MEKVYTRFQTKRPKNHTLWGGTTYMAYIRGYPPPGIGIHPKGHIVTLTLTYELSFFIIIFLFYYFRERQQSDEEKGEECGYKRQEGQQKHQTISEKVRWFTSWPSLSFF